MARSDWSWYLPAVLTLFVGIAVEKTGPTTPMQTIAFAAHEPLALARSFGTRRPLAALLDPLDRLAEKSSRLIARHDARFEVAGEHYTLPRYLFIGPDAGNDPIRIGIFAAIHGDEPATAFALSELLHILEATPALAAGYAIFAYPVVNPTGFEDDTRHSRRGRDLNREFWNNSKEPEVLLLQSELVAHAFHGLIALHADDTSDGLYGFVRGATLTKHLIEPALAAGGAIPAAQSAVGD